MGFLFLEGGEGGKQKSESRREFNDWDEDYCKREIKVNSIKEMVQSGDIYGRIIRGQL